MQPKPIRPTDCFKAYTFDQDKVMSPVETVRRFKKKLAQVKLEILKEVRRIDSGRLDIPVYFSVCGRDAFNVIGNKKQMGKGSTPEQSQASACMELAERFSFFSFTKEPSNFIYDTYANLKKAGQPLLPLTELLKSVHDDTMDLFQFENLFSNIPLQWTWATNLTSETEVLVPFSWFFAINEFNGPSAGNTYEEAILQGISEIVERHVCAVVSHEKLPTPAIDPDSVKDPVACELIAKFKKHNIDLYLNDFTLDTGIPTVAALAIDRNTFPETSEIVYTAGTTPCPEKALIRAITEVAQLAGDFNSKSNYVASGLPKPLSMEEIDYVADPGSTTTIDALPNLSNDNMKVEIDNYLKALAKLDMEVLIVNTMHPNLEIPTIYTIVPGAHFRERSMLQNAGLFTAKLVYEQISDTGQARQQLLEMQEILPGSYFIEFYLGKIEFDDGRYEAALRYFEAALEHNPASEDIPYIFSYMGSCLKEMERYEKAIDVLRKGTELDDERPDLHNLLGFCHFKLQDYESAIHHFGRTVELNPASAIDYANLGVNHNRLGQKDEAVKYFQIALSIDPSIDFAREQLHQLVGISS